MPPLVEQLREQRRAAREAADQILTRASEESRDLTPDELAEHRAQVVAEREANDAIEAEHARELSEVRAQATRRPGREVPQEPLLTREQSVYDWLQARGAFDPAEAEGGASTATSVGWRRASGTAPSTSGRWPRRSPGPVAPWSPRRCPPA